MPVTPLDAATDVMSRARGLLTLDVASTPQILREDLRRAALAFGVASLDTYMHWAIRTTALDGPLPKKLAELEVPFGDMLAIARDAVTARQDDVNHRPTVKARNALGKALVTQTFQSPRSIERGLQMLGKTNVWSRLASQLPPATAVDLKERLGNIAYRRNKIVHEGDLTRLQRPQKIKYEQITAAQVADDLDWLEAFIKALAAL
ncbi:hypothetical protein [Streptomyces litmocidini]|uniref:RiboL-PSP-HEPN domain-containing protein n=1 Tax=Streptomyces litmocidini TaxID=67318 RepID=A0ABW7UF75_9ACTN